MKKISAGSVLRAALIHATQASRPVIMRYPVLEDGSLGPGDVFFNATFLVQAGKTGLFDGLKVAPSGHVLAAGPGGLLVLSPAGAASIA